MIKPYLTGRFFKNRWVSQALKEGAVSKKSNLDHFKLSIFVQISRWISHLATKKILTPNLLFFSGLILLFFIFWLQAVCCQAAPAWLGEGDYSISWLISWINRLDLIYQLNVLEIADRGPSRRLYLLKMKAWRRRSGLSTWKYQFLYNSLKSAWFIEKKLFLFRNLTDRFAQKSREEDFKFCLSLLQEDVWGRVSYPLLN